MTFAPLSTKSGTINQKNKTSPCSSDAAILPPSGCLHRHAHSEWPLRFSGSSFYHGQTLPEARLHKYRSSRFLDKEQELVRWTGWEFTKPSNGSVHNLKLIWCVSVEPCPATKTLIHLGGWSLGSPFFWRSLCRGPQSGGSPSWLEQGPLGGASGSRTALPADMWGNSMRQTLKGYV